MNISEDEYHYKYYYNLINSTCNIKFFDNQDVIEKLKELRKPPDDKAAKDCELFLFMCYFLYSKGYLIEEFPTALSRPKSLLDFSYNQIRAYSQKKEKYMLRLNGPK